MNMEIIGPFILTLFSGFSTLIGLIPIYFKVNRIGHIISFSLSVSYFILLYICFFDLIPNSLSIIFNEEKLLIPIICSILSFIVGYTLIYFLKVKENHSSLYRVGIISMVSIILHNIPEGIIVFMSSYKSIKIGFKTVLAIMLHNMPEGLLISIPIYYSTKNKNSAFKKVFLASISEPIGALLSYFILGRGVNDLIMSYILLFVCGIMISLCVNEIYKELLKYNYEKYILYGFELSSALIIILSLLN